MAANFRFGLARLDDKTYTRDFIALPDSVIENWWRKEGHQLCIEDLASVALGDIEVLVVGTGAMGMMRVSDELRRTLESRGIQVIAQPTGEALQTFVRLRSEGRRVAGAFHLTC